MLTETTDYLTSRLAYCNTDN